MSKRGAAKLLLRLPLYAEKKIKATKRVKVTVRIRTRGIIPREADTSSAARRRKKSVLTNIKRNSCNKKFAEFIKKDLTKLIRHYIISSVPVTENIFQRGIV